MLDGSAKHTEVVWGAAGLVAPAAVADSDTEEEATLAQEVLLQDMDPVMLHPTNSGVMDCEDSQDNNTFGNSAFNNNNNHNNNAFNTGMLILDAPTVVTTTSTDAMSNAMVTTTNAMVTATNTMETSSTLELPPITRTDSDYMQQSATRQHSASELVGFMTAMGGINDNKEEKLRTFQAVCGFDAERARFYLEANIWNVDVCVGWPCP